MADLGYAQGYKYAHDYPRHIVDQEYLPEEIREPFTLSPVRMVMRDELRNGSTNAGPIKPLKIKQKENPT